MWWRFLFIHYLPYHRFIISPLSSLDQINIILTFSLFQLFLFLMPNLWNQILSGMINVDIIFIKFLSGHWRFEAIYFFMLFYWVWTWKFHTFVLFSTVWFDWGKGILENVYLLISVEVKLLKLRVEHIIFICYLIYKLLSTLLYLFLVYIECQ